MDRCLQQKLNHLKKILKGNAKLAVAYSGGVDSTLLLKAAVEMRTPEQVTAIMALGPMIPESEAAAAEEHALKMGILPVTFQAEVMDMKEFVENGPRRCYYCKKYLFREIQKTARAQGCEIIMDGTNADDVQDYRPGRQALTELGIASPLLKAGMTKADIRSLSRYYGLETADKPAMACLATRIPVHTRITQRALKRAEAGEELLRKCGLRQYRLRVIGDTARIECLKEEIPLLEKQLEVLEEDLKRLGFLQVELDQDGYVCGSMNGSGVS